MNSKLIQLADRLVQLVNAANASDLVAIRKLAPSFELRELAQPKLIATPRGVSSATYTRAGNKREATIDICLLARATTDEQTDEYIAAMEAIEEYVSTLRLVPLASATWGWQKNELSIPYEMESLAESKVFEAIISATFRRVQ